MSETETLASQDRDVDISQDHLETKTSRPLNMTILGIAFSSD